MNKVIFLIPALSLFFAAAINAQTVYAPTIKVPVTFYDFHANGSNPDFEPAPRIGTGGIFSPNEVGDTLDLEKKPMLGATPYFSQRVAKWFRPWQAGDFTVPVYSSIGVYLHDSTVTTDTSYKNIVILDTLIFDLVPGSAGVYQLSSAAFFRLDGKGFGNEPAGQNPPHNYSFSMEMHWEFIYQTGLSFSLSGDDDIWTFINGHRVIDLGGIHGPFASSVNLDTMAGMTVGHKYMLDLFYTERHVTGSDILITTNIIAGAPSVLAYKHNPVTYTAGTAITPDTAVVTGIVDSFTVAPPLPTGLSLSKATGIISGTPTIATATASYTVIAINAVGSTTASLSITVGSANTIPVITTQPQSQTVVPGQAVTFTVVVTGNSPLTYQWRMNGTAIAGATSASFTIAAVSASHAATYSVAVTNSAGSVTSNNAVLSILAKANFTASATSGKIPLTVTFTDASLGVVTKRYWYFGDNTTVDSSVSPSHLYATEGSFNAKLVVFNYSGARGDSMTVVIRTYNDNPVLISGRLVSSGKVEITYTNYSVLPTGPLPPFADSIALWYKPGSIPLSGTGTTYAKNYMPAAMQSQGKGNPVKDTISLQQPLSDTVYGFITAVHWTDGTWSKFTAGNGCLVRVLSTTPPGTPTLVFPASGAVNVPVAVTFKWHPVPTASTYRLQVSTTPDFSAIVEDSAGLADTSLSLSNLSYNSKYYWCVNATNAAGTSGWSTTTVFTTVPGVPGPVLLVNPQDTAKIQGDVVLLVWNKALPAVTKYMVQIATDSGMSHILLADSTVTDTSTILMSLIANTSYWWQVKANNSSGWGPYSSKYKFTILPASVLPGQRKIRAFDVQYSTNVLRYALPVKCHVSVKYYDVKGRTIASFVNKIQSAGYYALPLHVSSWSKGIYIQVFKAGNFERRETIITAK